MLFFLQTLRLSQFLSPPDPLLFLCVKYLLCHVEVNVLKMLFYFLCKILKALLGINSNGPGQLFVCKTLYYYYANTRFIVHVFYPVTWSITRSGMHFALSGYFVIWLFYLLTLSRDRITCLRNANDWRLSSRLNYLTEDFILILIN